MFSNETGDVNNELLVVSRLNFGIHKQIIHRFLLPLAATCSV
jgi:hypothetical protein